MKCRTKFIAIVLLPFFLAGFLDPCVARAITIQEEEEIAKEMMKMIFKRYEIVKDPCVVDYVNGVGEKILKQVPEKPFKYEFFVIKQNVYNAFAIPLAAGVAYAWGILLSPALGAAFMSLSTIVVAINAKLLERARKLVAGTAETAP